jgi:hypothetical protein
VQVAAGPAYVVELVNLALRVWRTGAGSAQAVGAAQPLSAFFRSGKDELTDPRVAYDALSGRWFASIADLKSESILLAVSKQSDPTQGWTVTSYPAPGCADQPHLGLADGTVVVAADIYADCENAGAPRLGSELWVIAKQELLDGSTTPDFTAVGPTPGLKSVAPAQSLSPTPTAYAVSVDSPASRVAHLFAVDGIPPAPVSVKEIATPAITRLSTPPFAVQPPSPGGLSEPPIDTNDDRVLDAVWENGELTFTADTACQPPGQLLRACGRVVQLGTDSGTVTKDQNIAQPGTDVYYPAARPDGAGNLVVAYGASSLTQRPELAVLGLMADGSTTAPVAIARSSGPYLGDRYGDYFGAARDPQQPDVVWIAGEAGTDVAGGRGWTTSVASVELTGVGEMPPAVLVAPPPALRAQPVSVRAGTRVQLPYTALGDGGGVRTVLSVSSKASLVYSATTSPLSLHAGQHYGVSWLPRKKLRGRTLAFCVHAVSSSGQAAPRSCSTVRLR